jgi:hypothetical protein
MPKDMSSLFAKIVTSRRRRRKRKRRRRRRSSSSDLELNQSIQHEQWLISA